jgi:hypothetical protein
MRVGMILKYRYENHYLVAHFVSFLVKTENWDSKMMNKPTYQSYNVRGVLTVVKLIPLSVRSYYLQ